MALATRRVWLHEERHQRGQQGQQVSEKDGQRPPEQAEPAIELPTRVQYLARGMIGAMGAKGASDAEGQGGIRTRPGR
jgi:hypothetical protein